MIWSKVTSKKCHGRQTRVVCQDRKVTHRQRGALDYNRSKRIANVRKGEVRNEKAEGDRSKLWIVFSEHDHRRPFNRRTFMNTIHWTILNDRSCDKILVTDTLMTILVTISINSLWMRFVCFLFDLVHARIVVSLWFVFLISGPDQPKAESGKSRPVITLNNEKCWKLIAVTCCNMYCNSL